MYFVSGRTEEGKEVFLRDIWPKREEIQVSNTGLTVLAIIN